MNILYLITALLGQIVVITFLYLGFLVFKYLDKRELERIFLKLEEKRKQDFQEEQEYLEYKINKSNKIKDIN